MDYNKTDEIRLLEEELSKCRETRAALDEKIACLEAMLDAQTRLVKLEKDSADMKAQLHIARNILDELEQSANG